MTKPYHKNPRTITEKQLADLGESLDRLGDLSGIVHNLETDEIISGTQRDKHFDISTAEIELVEKFDEPDRQGTIAHGFVNWQGHKYAYRAVRWDEKTAEEANIRANKAGGDWDFEILGGQFDQVELMEWGFEAWEFESNEPESPDEFPEYDEDIDTEHQCPKCGYEWSGQKT